MKYIPLINLKLQSPFIGIVYGVCLLLVGILRPAHLLVFGIVRQGYVLSGLGLSIIMIYVAVITRFYVIITDEMLIVRGFFFANRIRWVDIKEVKPCYQGKVQTNPVYGLKYKFIALNGTVSINFRLFSKECYDEVFKRIPVQTT